MKHFSLTCNRAGRLFLLLPMLWFPALIQAHNDTIIRQLTDTITTVNYVQDSTLVQHEEVVPADSTDTRGHYIQAHIGAGYGSLGYKLSGAQNNITGSFSALMQLQYAYFFHPNWGVGLGLWFTNYTSFGHLGGIYTWLDQTDTDTEMHYDHHADVRHWRERETTHTIGIPVSLQFQWKPEDRKAGLFASLGVAPSFSVLNKYRVLEGEIDHSGYYPAWDLTLSNLHEFGTKRYEDEPNAKGILQVKPMATLFADLGALIPLTRQIDLLVGGYANVGVNDVHATTNRTPLGWQDQTFTFMPAYQGIYETDLASASHPWEAGVKIGIHWHHIGKGEKKIVESYDYFTRPDTVMQYQTRQDTVIVEHPDTIVKEPIRKQQQKIAEEVEKFNKIYFAFDSDHLTHKSRHYLDTIASVLKKNAEVRVEVRGHASSEGQSEYNDILSGRRAKAVTNYLVKSGIAEERITIKGFGSRVPNDETDREEMKRDRRVEVVVVDENNNQ